MYGSNNRSKLIYGIIRIVDNLGCGETPPGSAVLCSMENIFFPSPQHRFYHVSSPCLIVTRFITFRYIMPVIMPIIIPIIIPAIIPIIIRHRDPFFPMVPSGHNMARLLGILRGEFLQHLQQRSIGRHGLVALLLHVDRLSTPNPGRSFRYGHLATRDWCKKTW